MYNHFRLLTSKSWNTQNRWSSIWFYPDAAESAGFINLGLVKRLGYVLDDAGETFSVVATSPLSNLISKTELAKLYVVIYLILLLERPVLKLPLFNVA